MPSQKIAALLRSGDRRSIGRSNEVVKLVSRTPKRFAELIQCLWSNDPIVRMRAADAAEKVSGRKPELLKPYRAELLGLLAEATQIEHCNFTWKTEVPLCELLRFKLWWTSPEVMLVSAPVCERSWKRLWSLGRRP